MLANPLHMYVPCSQGASSDSFYFTVNPTDQDVEEGQPVRLECAVHPSNDIFYSWSHNGSHINIDGENGRRNMELDSNLQILHADRELDQGMYQCKALNRSSTFATASREAQVNIYCEFPICMAQLMSTQLVCVRVNMCVCLCVRAVGVRDALWMANTS